MAYSASILPADNDTNTAPSHMIIAIFVFLMNVHAATNAKIVIATDEWISYAQANNNAIATYRYL